MTAYQFTTEIQRMMFSLGDSIKPIEESANLIETIVLDYLIKVMYQLEEICRLRESKIIGIEELMFLFRKDRIKLTRIIHFLKFKDMKANLVKDIEVDDENIENHADDKMKNKKRLKICHDFLSQIDPNGTLLSLLESDAEDELKKQRRIRLEKLTRQLTTQQYLAYCEARQTSFAPGNKMQKFNDWLFSRLTDFGFKVSQYVNEVLCYLAYEAVAEVVESALLVKKDAEMRSEDPLTFYSSSTCVNYELSANLVPKSEPVSCDVTLEALQTRKTNATAITNVSKQTAITSAEIREAMRRLSQYSTLFSCSIKSVPPSQSRQLWL